MLIKNNSQYCEFISSMWFKPLITQNVWNYLSCVLNILQSLISQTVLNYQPCVIILQSLITQIVWNYPPCVIISERLHKTQPSWFLCYKKPFMNSVIKLVDILQLSTNSLIDCFTAHQHRKAISAKKRY